MRDGIRVASLFNAAVSGTGTSTTAVDVSGYYGTLVLNVAARSGGSGTMAIAVEHSDSASSGFVAVPTDALYNQGTGAAASFTSVTTAATNQSLGLVRQKLRQYVRVTFSGSGLTQNVAVTLAGTVPYTETL